MGPSKHDEVLTLLKLYEMATTANMRMAQSWVLSTYAAGDFDTFQRKYPVGSVEWRHFTDACGMMELFGVLLKHDLVREDPLFDLFGGIDLLWERVKGVIPGMREAVDSRLYENFELLYARHQSWKARQQKA
jgi:hypothetical protein